MYSLSVEQKLSNIEELIAAKRKKINNLETEIKNLEAKAAKLRSTESKEENPLLRAANRATV